jgi:hypothetical protein
MEYQGRTERHPAGRREFLRGAGLAAYTTALGLAAPTHRVMAGSGDDGKGPSRGLEGLDPKNLVDEVKARNLDAVSDAELFREAAAIVSRPPERGFSSFALHAPLEVMARYGLLRLVSPSDRELARLQMIASAAAYGSNVTPFPPPPRVQPFPDLNAASAELARTFTQADAGGMEALVLQIAEQFGTASLVSLLTPLALPTLTGASHSHIGLWLLLRHGEAASISDAALLRTAARAIASHPNDRMKSFSGMAIDGGKPLKAPAGEIERQISAKLANPPKGRLGSQSIRSVIEAGEATGNADSLFGDLIKHDLDRAQIDAAFRAGLRVCARSMLEDDIKQAKFGWTHCLTLPQSACGLASLNTDRKLALGATLVWTTAYRSILSRRSLDLDWTPEKVTGPSIHEALYTSPQVAVGRVWHADESEWPEIRVALATEASIRNDQHLVKYTRATLDMGAFDPGYTRLYLAAAAHLCALWIAECPRETLRDRLLAGRSTQ